MIEIKDINEVPLGEIVFNVSVQVRPVITYMTQEGIVEGLSEKQRPFYGWSKAVVEKKEEGNGEVIIISSTNGEKIVETTLSGVVKFSCLVPDKKFIQSLLTI